MLSARELFRRARLVVVVHGAGLSHTIFMPSNASVLEIRPRDYHNTCLHHLAEACDLNYYLLLGKGNKKGTVRADPREIIQLVEKIVKGWEDEKAFVQDIPSNGNAGSYLKFEGRSN
ncbi:unnamed protein product [Closterium sp. NIES-54]